jgi:hypothetical protein
MFLEIGNLVDALFDTGALANEQVRQNLAAYFAKIEDSDYRDAAAGELGVKCILLDDLDRGRQLLLSIEKRHERCLFLCQASEKISQSKTGVARDLLQLARHAAQEMTAGWEKAECLNRIASIYHRLGDENEALAVWEPAIEAGLAGQQSENRQDSLDASSVLADVALNLARTSKHDLALQTAHAIKNEYKKEQTLKALQNC